MGFGSSAWLWVYAGALLMLLELVAPGFVLCFFGLSAATVGLLRFLIGEALDPTWQLASFSFFSVLYIVLLRRWFKRALMGDKQDNGDLQNDYLGRTGRVIAAIEPPLEGRIVLGDAEWKATAERAIPVGANIKVISQNNLTMKVEEL